MRNPAPNTSGLKRGGSPGRPKGRKSQSTLELLDYWKRVLTEPDYLDSAYDRVKSGKAPHLETYFLNKVWGKPTETHEVTGAGGGPILFGWQSSSRASA